MWLLLSSCGLLVGYSLVTVCGLFSSYGEGLFSCNIYGELSLIAMCRGLLSCCGGGAHLNFPQSDFSLCIMSGGLLSHCGWWLLLRSGGVLCLTWALASGLLLSCSGSSSKVVMRGSEGGLLFFWHWMFLQVLAWLFLSTCEGLLSIYFRRHVSVCSRSAPFCV